MSLGMPYRASGTERPAIWPPIAVLVISVATVVIFWAIAPPQARFDATDYRLIYRPVALKLLAGEGPVMENGVPALKTPPGYPLILAAVFATSRFVGLTDEIGIAALNLAMMPLSSVLVFILARRVLS